MVIRRLLLLGALAWVARWATLEAAARLAGRPGRPPRRRRTPSAARLHAGTLTADTLLAVDVAAFRERVERSIRRHRLIPEGGEVVCLVSGGPDSTCLWHVLRELGYRVSALHVDHGLRGASRTRTHVSAASASEPRSSTGAGPRTTEDELRRIRYSFATDRLRATGHTASDQVETGSLPDRHERRAGRDRATPRGRRRQAAARRPWREETEAYCDAAGLPFRRDSSNSETKRGFIRQELLPRLIELDPRAEANLLRLAERRTITPALAELLDSEVGAKRLDLGGGRVAVREYDSVWLEHAPVALEGEVRWGAWTIRSGEAGLKVRGWRAGDRLAGRNRRSRMCSWTPRCRVLNARPGRSSSAAPRSWPCRASRRRPATEGLVEAVTRWRALDVDLAGFARGR